MLPAHSDLNQTEGRHWAVILCLTECRLQLSTKKKEFFKLSLEILQHKQQNLENLFWVWHFLSLGLDGDFWALTGEGRGGEREEHLYMPRENANLEDPLSQEWSQHLRAAWSLLLPVLPLQPAWHPRTSQPGIQGPPSRSFARLCLHHFLF